MKIFELHYSTSWAGAERVVVDLSNELAKSNEVVLCTIEDDSLPGKSYYKKELSPNIKYINLKCQSGLQLKALWRIYKTIKKEKPDIVHAHTDLINLFLPTLLYTKTRYFHTLHSLAEKCLKKPYLKCMYKWFYKNRIQAITISNACLVSYKQLYHLNNGIKIENGRSSLSPSTKYEQTTKEIQKLKIHPDDKVFVHIARCEEAKNQELLVNAFSRILQDNIHAILLMIGANYDAPHNQHLFTHMPKGMYCLGLKNNIGDYLLNANFFILSSKWEGLPISLLEALSCGVIPICTPAGGIPDIIIDEQKGFLSPDFTEDNFYKAIKKAIQKESSFERKNLITYFQENYSMQHCANLYLKTFKNDTV